MFAAAFVLRAKMRCMKRGKVRAIWADDELWCAVKKVAVVRGVSVSQVVRDALMQVVTEARALGGCMGKDGGVSLFDDWDSEVWMN